MESLVVTPPISTDTDKYECKVCNFETKYSCNLSAHYKSLKHIANTELINETRIVNGTTGPIETSQTDLEATCELCNITFMTIEKRDLHLKSKRHQKILQKKKSNHVSNTIAGVENLIQNISIDSNDGLVMTENDNKIDQQLSMMVQDEVADTIEEITKEMVLMKHITTPIQFNGAYTPKKSKKITKSKAKIF